MRGAALITGAARRIGRELALEAARLGYDVAIHHRDAVEEAARLGQEISGLGRRSLLLHADLADESEVGALIPQATDALGPVTLLVNNASLFQDDRLPTLTRASWDAHMSVNLRAPIVLLQAFAEALPPERHGLAVNILDQRVTRPNPQFFSYTLAKTALYSATMMAAQALSPRIRVNGIGPGPTLPSIHQQPEDFAAEAAATPLRRSVDPTEIAAALRYLVDAPSVTGQMIAVDAGQHLAWQTPDILGR